MTTATTSTTVAQDTAAHFNAWFNEVLTQLAAVGLTQTADTGQISTGGAVAIPAINTSAGFTIWRFNDTLQATKPLFFKLEFGSDSQTTRPQMWITVGSGSNGSGTLTGTLTVRVSVAVGSVPTSLVTNYTSRWCYDATNGFFGMMWKIGAGTGANIGFGGLFIFRSVNSSGATTGDGVAMIADGFSAIANVGGGGNMQTISFNTSTAYPVATPSSALCSQWGQLPGAGVQSTYGGNCSVMPCWSFFPFFALVNQLALAINNEIPVGNTYSLAMIGSIANTYMSVGWPFGNSGALAGCGSTGAPNGTLCMLWQ